jgi:hypothetical protein
MPVSRVDPAFETEEPRSPDEGTPGVSVRSRSGRGVERFSFGDGIRTGDATVSVVTRTPGDDAADGSLSGVDRSVGAGVA